MPSPTNKFLTQMREEYPEYVDVDDTTLAKAYGKKHYAYLEEDVFLEKVGLHQSTLLDDAIDLVTPTEKPFTQDNNTTEPSLHDAIAPNVNGSMPATTKEQEKPFSVSSPAFTQSEDLTTTMTSSQMKDSIANETSLLLGEGKDFENPDREDYELGKRVVNATNKSTSGMAKGLFRVMGSTAYTLIRPFSQETATNIYESYMGSAKKISEYVYEDNKFDVKSTHTPNSIKEAVKAGGIFDIDTVQEVLLYGLDTTIESVPDMAEIATMFPAYVLGKAENSALERAKNDGRKEATNEDFLRVLPTATTSALLDKMGLEATTSKIFNDLVKTTAAGGIKAASIEITKKVRNGTLTEAVTEAGQTVIDKMGEEIGTKSGLSSVDKYAEEAAWASLAGGIGGGAMSGTTATGTIIFNEYSKADKEAQREAYIQDSYNKQMLGSSSLTSSIDDNRYVVFKNNLDTKVKNIQTEFQNLVINNPGLAVPVEAVNDIAVQKAVVQTAKEDGLNVSDNNGLNAIDAGFKELEAEIGTLDEEMTPKGSEVVNVEPIPIVKTPIDTARLTQLQETPADELTVDEQFELEDLQIEEQQIQKLGNDETALVDANSKLFQANKSEEAKIKSLGKDEIASDELTALIKDGFTFVKKGDSFENTTTSIGDRYIKYDEQGNKLTKYSTGDMEVEYSDGESVMLHPDGTHTSSLGFGGGITTAQDGTLLSDEEAILDEVKSRFITNNNSIKTIQVKVPTIDEARDKQRESKKSAPTHISEQLALNEKLYANDETALADANAKLFQANKSEEAKIKSLGKDEIKRLDDEYFTEKYSDVEVQRAYDFLPTATKQSSAVQASLDFAGTQNPLFNTKGSEEYIVPTWAKDIVSDTLRYDDIITAVTDAKNGNPTDTSFRVMDALHKAGDPHLENEIKRFDELSQRWDLNELEEAEQSELAKVLDKHLTGVEDGTITRAEESTRATQDETADNEVVQAVTEQGLQQTRSTKESDRSLPDSFAAQKPLVFDTAKVYDTRGINHENPHNKLSEIIKKDVARYVSQLAKNLGYDFEIDKKGKKKTFNGVNNNIAVVGGSISFKLFKPNSDAGIYVSLNYDSSMTDDGRYDTYFLNDKSLGHFFRTINGIDDHTGGKNNWFKTEDLTSDTFVNKIISLVEAQEKRDSDIINKEVKEDEKLEQPTERDDGRDILETLSTVDDGKSSGQSRRVQPDSIQGTDSKSQKQSIAPLPDTTGRQSNSDDGRVSDERLSASRSEVDGGEGTHSTVSRLEETADNFEIEDALGKGGLKTKFKTNIEAIKIVKKIQTKNYKPTKAEKTILSQYVGWGGLANAFVRPNGSITKGWEKESKELKELLSDDEYKEAKASTLNAHYTSKEIVDAIWSGVKQFGFKGGKVLEPSVGVGNFFGMMPTSLKSSTKLYGVELDGITSTIAQTLYPKATIQNKGFQDVELSNDFSLVIGNPPFGSVKLFDKNNKHLKDMSIHNYFFAKSMDALEEGGILAMVVSNGLMDASSSATREYLGSKANLLGAIRLPNNAFSKNANTEVTTDIIFLQKRYKSQESNIDTWRDIGEINDTPLNQYFVNNEAMMLGKWGKYGSMYRGDMPALVAFEGSTNTAGMLLPDALKSLPSNIVTHETIIKENTSEATFSGDVSKVRVGAMYVSDGYIYKRELDVDGEPQVREVTTKLNSKNKIVEYKPAELLKIKGMIEVVSVADELRVLQLNNRATDKDLARARKALNKSYEAFTTKHKFLNNATNKKLFEDDVRSPFLLALEKHYDKGVSAAVAKKSGELVKKESAVKADIFTKRTQNPYARPTKADSEQDALTVSLSEYGSINLGYMQELTAKSEAELISALDGFMYDDVDAGWVTKEEYLSGNVKEKFALTDNVKYKKALQEVIPKDIEAMDISITLGAGWVPKDIMADFVEFITGDDAAKVTLTPHNARWTISARVTSAKASQWGTKRRTATEILEQTMNLKQMKVQDNHGTSSQPQLVTNIDETTAVQEKQEVLKEEFKEWIFKTADRRTELAEIYNREFNTKTLREYDGSHINFVGKSEMINLRQHQKNGVWRMLQGGTVLFDHTVGTGKTFTAIAGVMELRRTGKANKPLVVVPNHLTSQWGKEWMELYPNANILVPTKADFSAARRKLLMSKIATGDYDAIIIAHSQLTSIQNDPEFETSFIEDEITRIQTSIDMLKEEDGKSRSVKNAEDSKAKLEERIKKLNDMQRDDNLNFAELGIDALILDEAHEFKNLTYTTGLQGVAGLGNPKGSKKAFDLFIKTQNILEKTNGNNVVFLTGTPISNTIAEMFTIQRYLDYSGLQDKNLDVFDAWVKQYAEIVSDWELSPSGKYKLNTRLRKFNNMPELITEYKQFGDVVTREDIPALPIPLIKGGRAANIVVERSDAQAAYIGVADKKGKYPEDSLVYRSEHLPKGKPKKGDDNMLSIMGLARKVALDMRLIDPSYEDNPDSKVNLTVKNTFEIYKMWNAKKGTQLIFCDLSTPKGAVAKEKAKIEALIKNAESADENVAEKAQAELDKLNPDDIDALNSKFSVYDDIKAKLIAKGIKESEVVFIHDAKTDLQKQELFAKVKSGKIRVLIGSTSKMGSGMNVQDKLVALHHIDVPWRPSDLEQREGRIIRQGNEFFKSDPEGFEVEIFRYATKNTLDSMMWQTIEAKANFIAQLRAGNLLDREVEDVSGEAINAAEMKAMSSGNPLVFEDMKLKKDIKKMEALKKSHDRNQYDLEDKIKKSTTLLSESKSILDAYALDAKLSKKLPKKFIMNINKKEYESREDAGKEILHIMLKTPERTSKLIGEIGGFKVYVETTGKGLSLSDTGIVTLSGSQDYEFSFNMEDQSYSGLTLKLENTIKNIATKMQEKELDTEYVKEQLPQLKEQVGEFKNSNKLDELRLRQKEVLAELRKKDDEPTDTVDEMSTGEVLEMIETLEGRANESFMKVPTKKEVKDTAANNHYSRVNGFDEAGVNYVPTYKTSGLPHRPATGTISIGNKEVSLPTYEKAMNADTIRVYLSEIIGNRLYQAKLKNKSALGKYKRDDSAIRVKNYSDIEVMAHEMAHYLDFFHNNKSKAAPDSFFRREILKNKEEIKALSYTTDPKNVISEGFAEFTRLWLTNYNSLTLVAPNMIKDFEAKLSKDKELNKKMTLLQESMHQYYYQGAGVAKYVGGELTPTAKKIQRSQAEIGKNFRQKSIDRIHSIKRIEAEIKGDVAVNARDSAYKSLQLVNGYSSIMYSAMNIGTPTVNVDGDISYSGKSLNDIFAPATTVDENRVKLMENYFVARRANELMEQGRENLITQEDIDADLGLAEIYPEFETIFTEYQEFNDAMLDFYVDMNLITSSQRENFQEMNKDYVPFHRINESVQYDGVATSKIGQRLTGGTSSLNSIMENIINGVESNIKEALISRGKSMFYEMLEESGMGGVYATKVSADSKVVQDNLKDQAKKVATVMAMMDIAVSKDGMILSGKSDATEIYDVSEIEENLLTNPKTMEVWTHGHPPTSADGYIDSVIINDKVVYFETKDIGIVDAMTSFSGSHYGTVVSGLMWMKNVMTWNITNNPLFYLTNFVRDTVSASVLSKNGFIPVITSLNGTYHFITRSKTYKEFMASGAGYGTRRTSLGGDIEAMKMLNVKRSLSVLDRVVDALEYGADMFEYGTRVGEFKLAQNSGKSNTQSAFEAREISTDFAIKGSDKTISGFMSTVPFMKAAILGLDKTARRIFSLNGEMKVSNALKFRNQLGELQTHKLKIYATGGMMAGLTLALWFNNKDDERYKRLTRDAKMMYWHFFIGEKHIKVPRPYDIGFVFSTVPELMADAIYTKEGKEAAKDFAWGVKNMFSIGDISGLFQPILDDMTNTNWTGSPIVPARMQNLDDLSDQYMNSTPLVYKMFGKITGASPIMTKHYVNGYLGLTARMMEEVTENILWNSKEWGARPFSKNAAEFMVSRFVAKEQPSRTIYSEKYYELVKKASAVKNSYDLKSKKAFIDGGNDVKEYMSSKEKQAHVQISRMLSSYSKELAKVKNSVEHITYNKMFSQSQKEEKINAAYAAKTSAFEKIVTSVNKKLDEVEGK